MTKSATKTARSKARKGGEAASSETDGKTKRTTLTLPADALAVVEEVARRRHATVSSVVSEVLIRVAEQEQRRQRVDEILADYQQAFDGFSEEELMILDGIVPETVYAERGQRVPPEWSSGEDRESGD